MPVPQRQLIIFKYQLQTDTARKRRVEEEEKIKSMEKGEPSRWTKST